MTPTEQGGQAWRRAAVQFCHPRLAPAFPPCRAHVRKMRTPAPPARSRRPEERRGAEQEFEARRATTSWGPPAGDERHPAAPPQRVRPGTFAHSVPRQWRRMGRHGALATPLLVCGGRCRGRLRLGIAPRPSILRLARRPRRRLMTNTLTICVTRRTQNGPYNIEEGRVVAQRTRNAGFRRKKGRVRSPQRRHRRPGTPRATLRNRDARRNTQCRRVIRPRAGGIPGRPHRVVPTERAGDARRRSAARNVVTEVGRKWRLSRGRAFYYARSVCDAVPLRRLATPSCDAVP